MKSEDGYADEVIDGLSKAEAVEMAQDMGWEYIVKGTQMWNEPLGQIEESSRIADYITVN